MEGKNKQKLQPNYMRQGLLQQYTRAKIDGKLIFKDHPPSIIIDHQLKLL